MKKRVLSFILTLSLLLGTSAPGYAYGDGTQAVEQPQATEQPRATEQPQTSENAVMELEPDSLTMSLAAFDGGLLGNIPATADPGSGVNAWGSSGDVFQPGNGGRAYSTSTLTLSFSADVKLSFQYMVSSEKNYDKFSIYHNGSAVVDGVSGELGWTECSLEVKAGDTVSFTYKKDSGGD